jgi:hypothetical protein
MKYFYIATFGGQTDEIETFDIDSENDEDFMAFKQDDEFKDEDEDYIMEQYVNENINSNFENDTYIANNETNRRVLRELLMKMENEKV